MSFHIQVRGPLNSIHNALLYYKGFEKGSCYSPVSLAFFCFSTNLSGSSQPPGLCLCSSVCLHPPPPCSNKTGAHHSYLNSEVTFLGRLPSVFF